MRIWFRRERGVDFEPKEDDVEDAKGRIAQIRSTMSEEDVMGAYDRGEEVSVPLLHRVAPIFLIEST